MKPSSLLPMFAVCLWLALIPASAATPANPLLLDDSVFVSQQGLHRFDLDSGESRWSSLAGVETFEPVAWRDLILVGSTQGLYALAADSGSVVWHIEKSKTVFTPSISKQAFAGSVHGELYAIDPGLGQVTWRRLFSGWVYSPVVNDASALLWTGGQAHRVYGLSAVDGSLQHEIATSQETVFSPLDIDRMRVAFNLFDGNTLVIDAVSGERLGIFPGSAQPNDLHHYGTTVYRSHRDGTLAAFDQKNFELRWRQSLTRQDLSIHPSQPGFLLLSDRDRELILIDLSKTGYDCRMQAQGNWMLPIQVGNHSIVHFQKQMKPPGIRLVQTQATCK